MRITEAIELATTEHVIHFLLTAYVETLHYYDTTRAVVPANVQSLPLTGKPDVNKRLHVLRGTLTACCDNADARLAIEEGIDVFTAACSRLRALEAEMAYPAEDTGTAATGRAESPRCGGAADGKWRAVTTTAEGEWDEVRTAARYRSLCFIAGLTSGIPALQE